ncbi:terminal deoxynucleotidyl transferase [Aspergillus bombycis]|uniref:Terminal deoxynucleotidyl transferase n=1 Tax=Aspergillus bombycis TaxID=109264 RepID=A0A1F8A8K1_9EURO|nr:terminal deoxynucleotidyl transferase [Aspergillus bombycis]OGM48062.1 terminal deoxynucleotidyl transferase [Aspergillus bombycis]
MSDDLSDTSSSYDGHGPSFSSCPAIFVLPTHLSLESLHQIEESLVSRDASLTYDASEARLILGKIGQKKRASLELRSRGVWTEDLDLSTSRPPAKKAGIHEPTPRPVEIVAEVDVVDLSTETESEEDGVRSKHGTDKHLKRPRPRSVSTDRSSVTSAQPSSDKQADILRVVRLEWLDRCLESKELVPLDPFVIYQARKVERPASRPSGTEAEGSQANDILQRAKQDTLLKPAPAQSSQFSRRSHEAPSSQHRPPKLYRQTTSENEETAPLPPAPDWVKSHTLYACMRSAPHHPPNERFINQLVKIRTVRELTLDEIGVRAYSTSIASIAAYPYEFRRPSEILTLPGCDAKIANLFAEYQQSEDGTVEAATALDTDPVLRVLHEFYNIWGVGAKTARDFYYHRQWRDLDDVVEYGWNSLSRVQQIGVKYYDEFLQGIPRHEVEDIAKIIHRHANLVRPDARYDGRGVECIVVGGYRRGKEVSGDVDLILSHRDESATKNLVVDIVGSLESEGWITHTLTLHMTTSNRDQQTLPYKGDDTGKHFDSLDKALVVWQDPNFEDDTHPTPSSEADAEEQSRQKRKRNPNPHRRVDIIISPWRTIGCAILGWSGDTTFERDLRRALEEHNHYTPSLPPGALLQRASGEMVRSLSDNTIMPPPSTPSSQKSRSSSVHRFSDAQYRGVHLRRAKIFMGGEIPASIRYYVDTSVFYNLTSSDNDHLHQVSEKFWRKSMELESRPHGEAEWTAALYTAINDLKSIGFVAVRNRDWQTDLKPPVDNPRPIILRKRSQVHQNLQEHAAPHSLYPPPDASRAIEPAIPVFRLKDPRPDISVGLSDGILADSLELAKGRDIAQILLLDMQDISMLISDPHVICSGLRFPFLIVETKAGATGGNLYQAQNQAAVGGSTALLILKRLSDLRDLNRENQDCVVEASNQSDQATPDIKLNMAFSITTEGPIHELWLHFRNPNEEFQMLC